MSHVTNHIQVTIRKAAPVPIRAVPVIVIRRNVFS